MSCVSLDGCHLPYSGVFQLGMSHTQHQSPVSLQTGVHCESVEVDPSPGSGDAPFGSSYQHRPLAGFIEASDDRTCGSGVTRSHPGVCSTPLPGDGVDGIFPLHSSVVYVSSMSSLNSSEGPLWQIWSPCHLQWSRQPWNFGPGET